MTKSTTVIKLVSFDAARYLNDDEAIAEYMTAFLRPTIPIYFYFRSPMWRVPREWRRSRRTPAWGGRVYTRHFPQVRSRDLKLE